MLQKRRIIAAGGDLRTVTAAARLGRQAEVLLAGFERLTALPLGVTAADAGTVPEQSADVLLLPVQRTDDRYDAPFSRAPVLLSAMLPAVRRGGLVLGGRLSAAARSQIAAADCTAADYAARESFAVRNAVPTAEAAIGIAMRELQVTISGLSCLILGAGRLSAALQPRLRAWGAEVTVAARRFADLARSGGGEGKPPFISARLAVDSGIELWYGKSVYFSEAGKNGKQRRSFMKLWKKLTAAVLKYGRDFELVCKNNVNKGTASVTVKGIGEYAGSSVTKTYQIK